MKTNNKQVKIFTYAEHIKKHTLKENTYNENCKYCNPLLNKEKQKGGFSISF